MKSLARAGVGIAGLLLALVASSAPSYAAESVNLILNWSPTADHSPFYYAKAQGWYEKAGIDLTIETGKGSGVSSLKVGSGGSPFGIADLATMLVAKSKGADVVAVMSIYANTGQTFYWLKSYGVNGPKDFPGHKIGNPPGDASRVMWPAFAKAAGIAPDAVNFVNVGQPNTSGTPTSVNGQISQTVTKTTAPVLASIFSKPFRVFSAKKFPGVIDSTDLSKSFANQGIKIPIRKDPVTTGAKRKAGESPENEDEEG